MPFHRSGVTVNRSPATSSSPDQHPVCAKRTVSKSTRPNLRTYCRGSSNAGIAPSQVRSQAMARSSPGSRMNRSRRSGSTTSMRNGPTEVSIRSSSSRDARTTWYESPRVTLANASWVPRFGYCPIPMIMNSSSEEPWRLK